jgi:hypothetical protein
MSIDVFKPVLSPTQPEVMSMASPLPVHTSSTDVGLVQNWKVHLSAEVSERLTDAQRIHVAIMYDDCLGLRLKSS